MTGVEGGTSKRNFGLGCRHAPTKRSMYVPRIGLSNAGQSARTRALAKAQSLVVRGTTGRGTGGCSRTNPRAKVAFVGATNGPQVPYRLEEVSPAGPVQAGWRHSRPGHRLHAIRPSWGPARPNYSESSYP